MRAAPGWSVSLALPGNLLRQRGVLVPAAVEELDEAHAALRQPPGEQAVGGERAGRSRLGAVHLEHPVGLLREVGQLGHGRLHAVGHLVLRDARGDFRIARLVQLQLVQLRQVVEHSAGASRCRIPAGFDRYSTGSPVERNFTPWYCVGRKPLPHSRSYSGWSPGRPVPCETMTTKAGRSLFSLPRP